MTYPPCPKCGSTFFGSTTCSCGRIVECRCHGPSEYDPLFQISRASHKCDFTWIPKEDENEVDSKPPY